MSPLEIFKAARLGQPAPRIPVFCNLIDQGADLLGLSPKEYFSRGEAVAEAQLRFLKQYGYDNVWCLHYVGKEAELLGCKEILFAEDGVPNVADWVINNLEDIARFEIPQEITQVPAWASMAECLSILRTEVGATHSICAYVTASTTLPSLLMGMEKWLELFLFGPFELRDELIRQCSFFVRQEIAALRSAGANVIVYATPFGSTSFIKRKHIETIVLPWMQQDLQDGPENMVYYCGMAPFNNVIDLVFEQLNLSTFYISPLADLAEAKQSIGSRGLTCGVIDDIKMIHWSSEQTRAEVKRIIDIGKVGGHFLFGNGLMPLAVPQANIHAMVETALEYGSLP